MLFSSAVSAQAPGWVWGRTTNENAISAGNAVCVDAFGNCYAAGYFHAPSVTFGTTTLTSSGPANVNLFLVKYGPTGNVIWAQNTGGRSASQGIAMATDNSGNIYLTGSFGDTTVFGSTTLVSNNGSDPIFIAKYNSSGTALWATKMGGCPGANVRSVTTDVFGNSYLTGHWQGYATATFGSFVLTSSDGGLSANIFIVKCDPSGNVVWARGYGSNANAIGTGLATDFAGNCFLTGYFNSTSITIESFTLYGTAANPFLVKFSPNGTALWAKSGGSSTFISYSNAVATDAAGNSYITGQFSCPTISFGAVTLTNSDNTSNGYYDVFLVKYGPGGNVVWAKSAGDSAAEDSGNSVFVDNAGDIYVGGYFRSEFIDFGATTLANSGPMVNGNYPQDIFLSKYSASGNVLWSQNTFGLQNEYVNSVAVDAGGNCYITGYFEGPTLNFGPSSISSSNQQMFVARTGADVGISAQSLLNNEIAVFPNPSNAVFHFEISDINAVSEAKTEIKIFDVFGKVIFRSAIQNDAPANHALAIDLSGNVPGIYFYRIYNSEKDLATGKLILN